MIASHSSASDAAEANLIYEAQKAAAKLLELKPEFILGLYATKLGAHVHPTVLQHEIDGLRRLNIPK